MFRIVLLASTAAALPGTTAAADFEGRAEYKITGSAERQGSALAVIGPGGARFHFEMTSPKMAQMGMPVVKATTLVKAGDKDHLYTIDDVHHTYAVIDNHAGAGAGGWKVKRLGPSSVAGYPCERVRVESDEASRPAEICIATTLGRVALWATAAGQGDDGVPAALARAGLDGLPIRWVENQGDSEGGVVLELVKVTKERIPASELDVPAGYTKRERPSSSEMRARMEERLKSLTPEQRKRIEQMLGGKGTGSNR